MLLGAHMSVSGGLSLAFERAQSIDTNTMQVFTKNQNRWEQKPAAPEEIARWFAAQEATGIRPVVSHAAYLLNLGTPDDALWEKSVNALIDELTRAEQLGILGVVLHPGAHMDSGEDCRHRPHRGRAEQGARGHVRLQDADAAGDDRRAGHGAGL